MHTKFWKISPTDDNNLLAEWNDSVMNVEIVSCPINDRHQREGKRITDLSIFLPKKIKDFVWTWYSECLLQDHIIKLFKAEALTGFEVKPVNARFKHRTDKKTPQLWELVVTGWAGMAPIESGIKVAFHCSSCNLTQYTVPTNLLKLIDERQWDGSDFFIIWPLPGFIFITNKVKKIIQKYNLQGIKIEPVDKLSFIGDKIGGGRLSYWMPEKRAKELGEPLSIY